MPGNDMKKRCICLILAFCLIGSGCNVNINDKSGTGVSDANVSGNAYGDKPYPQENGEESTGADIIYDDGSPWIDSDLKINIKKLQKPDVKDDYYLAVNYDWLKAAKIADGHTSESSFTAAERNTVQRAMDLLEDDSITGHDAALVRALYGAMTDWDKRGELGMDPVRHVIDDINGINSLEELNDFICDPDRSNCVNTFVSIANETDLRNSERYITYINNDTLLLEDAAEYAVLTSAGERAYEAKKKLATAMLVRLGMDEKEARARFDRLMGFEERLAEKALTRADLNSADIFEKINNVYTADEIGKLTGSFPLMRFIEGFGYKGADSYAVYQPEFIKRLDELYTEDNLDVMKDYMMIHYLIYASDKLDRECYDLALERINTQFSTTGSTDDKTTAYNMILKLIPEPLERMYLKKYDAAGMKDDITDICKEIMAAYRVMLKEEEWLSEDTRKAALSKLDKIRINAVYPDVWTGYDELDLEGLDYMDCLRAVNKFNLDIDRKRTGQEVNRDLWPVKILQCNAFYNKQDNSINIILGILDDAFYNTDMSREEKLGGIGTVIGHEISHAFDEKGAQFDADGNLGSWWKGTDYKAYGERISGLAARYDNIRCFNGTNADGGKVSAEAVADIAGMKAVLMAVNDEDDFDKDKFFRQYAKVWRGIMTPEAEYDKLIKDQHPLNYLRVNVTLQQFDEFYETYGITENDGMYIAPGERISVW